MRLVKADFALAAPGGAPLASPAFKNFCVFYNAPVLAFNIDGGALFEQMLMQRRARKLVAVSLRSSQFGPKSISPGHAGHFNFHLQFLLAIMAEQFCVPGASPSDFLRE